MRWKSAASAVSIFVRASPGPRVTERAMNDYIKGCDRNDTSLTLYRLRSHSEPSPLSGGYGHVRCGYRPPSKIQNGILLCDACIAKFGLPALTDARLATAVG